MKSGVFADAIESSAKVLGRKDVRVIFEGSQAHTDGNTIVLPALPASSDITVDQADVLRGYRDHESMHVRCTDTSRTALKQLNDMTNRSKGLGALVQYCEDIRIEHAGVLEYPGMKHSLSAVNTHGAKSVLENIESKGDAATTLLSLPKPLQFRLVLQQVGRSAIGVESDGVFEKLAEVIKAADPKLYDLAAKYGKRMAELPTGFKGNKLNEATAKKGTTEAFALAEEIYTAYGEHEKQNPPPPPPPPDQPPPPPEDQPDDEPQGQPAPQDDSDKPPQDDPDQEPDDQPTQQPQPSDDAEPDDAEPSEPPPEDGDGSDGDGSEDDEDDGSTGSGDSDSEDDGDGDGDGSGNQSGGDAPDDSPEQDAEPDQQPSDGEQGDDSPPQSSQPAQAHSNGMDDAAEDPCGIDDVYKQALDSVVSDINQGPDIGKGKVLNKGMFQTWSSRFSLKLPVDTVVYHSHDVAGSSSSDGVYRGRIRDDADNKMTAIESSLTGKRAMIRRILELELQARNDRKWESGHKSGRLQSVRLVQAIQGRETVYQQRENGKDMDTLLHISIDGSGSMRGGNANGAISLAYALSEALERTGCDITVEMWGSRPVFGKDSTYSKSDYENAIDACESEIRDRRQMVPYSPKYVCFGLLTRGVIKSKRQRTTAKEVRTNFGLACGSFLSGTPTYHAVFSDLKDMSKENHAKKIYLHITDGDADGTLEGHDGADLMKEAHTYAAAIGVHMIGVGISGMHVGHLFSDSVEVSGPDAYEPVIRKLAKLVAQEAGHAAHFKREA